MQQTGRGPDIPAAVVTFGPGAEDSAFKEAPPLAPTPLSLQV